MEIASSPARARSSVLLILIATAISGLAGLVVTWLVVVIAGPEAYALFAVFWSALFLVVGILFGLQQEATRATAQSQQEQATGSTKRATSLWAFAAGVAVVVGTVVLAVCGLLEFESSNGLYWFVVVGAALNCLVATASGVMAGAGMWRQLAAIVALDGVLRVLGILTVLSFSHDIRLLAAAVIAPFPLSLVLVFLSAPRAMIANARVTIGVRRLIANSSRTMLAASATALLINGFPILLIAFAPDAEQAMFGSLVLEVTLTRAPILVPLTALSSFMVSRFSHDPTRVARTVAVLLAGIAIVVALLCLAAWLWGETVMVAVFGPEVNLGSGVLVALIASSGTMGALFVSGSAVLARNLHGLYLVGWLVATAVAVLMLFTPVYLPIATALALAVGPLTGLVVHLVGLRLSPRPVAAAEAASSSPVRP